MHKYSAYRGTRVLGLALKRTTVRGKLISLQDALLCFETTSVAFQYFDGCTTVLSTCTAIYVEIVVRWASSSVAVQLAMDVIRWLLFFGHPPIHLFDTLLLDLRINLP